MKCVDKLGQELLARRWPCPQWKWAKREPVVHCTCERTPYRGSRNGPYTEYHKMRIHTTNLAHAGPFQLVDACLDGATVGKPGRLDHMSACFAECTGSKFQGKKAAWFAPYSRPPAASVVLWSSKLVSALSAQPSACHSVDPGR